MRSPSRTARGAGCPATRSFRLSGCRSCRVRGRCPMPADRSSRPSLRSLR
ncbi:MAG: hypothetical protein MZV64_23655 [Ignavibacteriales bacterium]|nr:hypothetical protein [Ignavibacteriales bacterium]